MSITNIISAIGNNNSIYPLLVRDCGIEVPSKIYLTYNQNQKESKEVAKLATRERFIDEYAVSAIWLGGIPLVGKIVDTIIKKKGYNPDVNLKLFKEEENKKVGQDIFQGIEYNIKKFEGKVSKEVIDDLKKVKDNKKIFEKLLSAKFIASTAIPVAMMGFVLPKLIFASSEKKIALQRAKEAKLKEQQNSNNSDTFVRPNISEFASKVGQSQKPSFTGNWASTVANYSTLEKMAVTDGGYAVGRVVTARNKNEAMDVAFKMTGMLLLNFVAPKYIAKILDSATGKAFNLDVALDPIMLNDKEFINAIKDQKLELPKSSNPAELLDFVDNNPKSIFVKYAQKFEKVKMLDNGVRDPRAYVDVKNLGRFRDDIQAFAKKAYTAEDIMKFAKKAKTCKAINILANVGLSSFLLAYCLPKVQFAFRKLVTGSDLEPGLANAEEREKA